MSHTIDQRKCTECVGYFKTPRCVNVCPVGACVPDPECRETKDELIKKWYGLHPEEEPAIGTY